MLSPLTPFKSNLVDLTKNPLMFKIREIACEASAAGIANTARLCLKIGDFSGSQVVQGLARDVASYARMISRDLAPTGTTGKLNPNPLAVSIPDQKISIKEILKTHALELGSSSDVRSGEARRIVVKNGSELLDLIVFRSEDGIVHAGRNICDHYGIEIQEGHVNSSGELVCPRHGFCQNHEDDKLIVPYLDHDHKQKKMKLASDFQAIEQDGKIYILGNRNNKVLGRVESTLFSSRIALQLIQEKRKAQFKLKDSARRWPIDRIITPVLSFKEFKNGVREFTLSNETFFIEEHPDLNDFFWVLDHSGNIIPHVRAVIKNNMIFTYPSSLEDGVASDKSHFNNPNWASISKIIDADPRSVLIANLEGDHAAYVHAAILVGRQDHKDLKIEWHFAENVFHLKLTSIQKHSPLYSLLGVGLNDRVQLTFKLDRDNMNNYLNVDWYDPVTGDKRPISVQSVIFTTPVTELKTRITILTNVVNNNRTKSDIQDTYLNDFSLKIHHEILKLLVEFDSSYDIDAVMNQPVSTEDKGVRMYIKDRDDYLRILIQWYEEIWAEILS